MDKFLILSKSIIINEDYCKIEKQKVKFPDESESDWFIHHSNDAVIVIPQTEGQKILLQKNYKHGGGEIVVEFCAGLVDDEETPIQAAKRELSEETGFVSNEFEFLGSVFANPTSSAMKYHFFVAKNSVKKNDQNLDSAEQIKPFLVDTFSEAKKILTDPKTKTSSASIAALGFWKD